MKKATIILCLSLLVIAGVAFFFLPEQIPMHFNAAGEIDRYGSRFEILLLPIVSLLITAGSILFKKIDPKKENYERFINSFWIVLFVVNMIMLVALVSIISESLYPGALQIDIVMLLMFAITFMVLGNVMPKIKANYFIGIRTPWTLANEEVWYKTHRFSGKVLFVGGFLMFFGILLPKGWIFFFIIAITLLFALISALYSYVCFKKINENNH